MCRHSHHALHTMSQLPHQLLQMGQILTQPDLHSLSCARSAHGAFLNAKGKSPLPSHCGTGMQTVPLCVLESAKCSIPDLRAKDGERDEPARTDSTTISTSSTSPRQNIPVSFTNLCIFLLFCCAHSCAIQWLRCLPSKGAACHAPPHPAVSCFLPLGDGACGRAVGGVSGRGRGSQDQMGVVALSKEAMLVILGQGAGTTDGQTDLAGQSSAVGLPLIPPSLFFFF